MILQATKEVGRPILFGILIISVVFLPLMTLHGMEGKMFAPLAYTLVIALLASVVVTLTLSPVLASLLLRGDHPEETRLTLWMKQRYVPVLQWTLRHRSLVLDRLDGDRAVQPRSRSVRREGIHPSSGRRRL